MFPKPTPRAVLKRRKQRADEKALKAFRDAVWERDQSKCQGCGVGLLRSSVCETVLRWRGEVHHRIGRRAKATRYDPNNGVLLCTDCHWKAQRHEIEV